ncbi:unnamed protein product [Sphenostylis stenocarpa]|uniref:Uncharacterized protein n=1 Tax=Sphenostylis stenocarpa TaxID=92480 RepID=A0AA86RYI2_9FABA|nr:unnamed protein product [Sphenostylis stenocarpa]
MGNKASSNSKVHGQVTRVVSTELGYDPRMGRSVSKLRNEYTAKPKAETVGTRKGQLGSGVYSDNTPLDNDETFTTFIRQAKYKIRTVSHIRREHSDVAPAPPSEYDEANGRDNQNDEFSDFIQSAKKKLRSTSSKRKNGSFNRG